MIFVTIGSMFPFDRMIRAMDAVASARADASEEIFAQIGAGAFEPAHMRWVRQLDRTEYAACVARARLVVAHAGVGSVIAAAEHGKPIVVVPRRAHLNEHTSDHQAETAGWLSAKPGVYVAETEDALADQVAAALAASAGTEARSASDASRPDTIATSADPAFIARLRGFILD